MRTRSTLHRGIVAAAAVSLATPVLAQIPTETVSVQCSCDWSVHSPGFDCQSYCVGKKGGGSGGGSSSGVSNILMQGLSAAMGAYFQQQALKKAQQKAQQEAQAAALQQQLQERLARERQQREQFERSKRATVDQMKGPKPGALQLKDVGQWNREQRLRQAELAAAARKRIERLQAELAALQSEAARASAVSFQAREPKESDYFYRLQTRRTGPGAQASMPALPASSESGYASTATAAWISQPPALDLGGMAWETVQEARAAAREKMHEKMIDWAKDKVIDEITARVPGASVAQALLEKTQEVYDVLSKEHERTFLGVFDQIQEGTRVAATGRDPGGLLERNAQFLEQRADGYRQAGVELIRKNMKWGMDGGLFGKAESAEPEAPPLDQTPWKRYSARPEEHPDYYRNYWNQKP